MTTRTWWERFLDRWWRPTVPDSRFPALLDPGNDQPEPPAVRLIPPPPGGYNRPHP